MPLDEQDKKDIQAMLDDGLAGAGDGFAKQAQAAATETIAALQTQVQTLTDKLATFTVPPAEQIQQLVGDSVRAQLKIVSDDQTAQQAASAKSQKRQGFLAAKAAKIPAIYHALIPDSDVEEELVAGMKKAIDTFTADVKAAGGRLADLGSPANGSGDANTEAARANRANLSPTAKIESGLAAQK